MAQYRRGPGGEIEIAFLAPVPESSAVGGFVPRDQQAGTMAKEQSPYQKAFGTQLPAFKKAEPKG